MRWAIFQPGSVPMGIAGIYRRWIHPDDGREMFAMAMLTVNADDHPFMRRFHKPGEEKRMVVILNPDNYGEWLACPSPPQRAPRVAAPKRPTPPQRPGDGGTGDLFGG